jgi:short-subunit dehydrogenase
MNNKNTILILGSGSDIAKAIAREFAGHGYAVLLAGRSAEQMERLRLDLISRYEAEVSCHHFDAVDFESHGSFVSSLPKLPEVIVYSAGAMSEQNEAQQDWKKAKNMIEVNYSGAVSILNRFAILFGERAAGCIVGISSVAGDRGRGSNYIYGSTKAAFSAYLSGLRNELFKKKVHVITIKPGFVFTKMTQDLALPPRLTAYPDKVAEAIFSAVEKNKSVLYVKPLWRWIMQIIKVIPEPIFKRTNL